MIGGMDKSPFPGMDPYLEFRWPSAHVLLMSAITIALNQSLPAGLEARPEEEVRVESLAGEVVRSYRADIAIGRGSSFTVTKSGSASTDVAEPIQIPYQHAPFILRDVRIVDTGDNDRIVTAIEVLSPWNKRSEKLNLKYIRKLHEFEAVDVNWVEIDLIRSSRKRLIVTWNDVPAENRADYLVTTYRAQSEKIIAYPIHLPDRLPVIFIPLREADEDVQLDLQGVLDNIYSVGSFRSIDYRKPLVPPLKGNNAEWAAGLIARR
jgi:hypothetical protein